MSGFSRELRQFLIEAFSPDEFKAFCFDHFSDFYREKFADGQTEAARVGWLIEYCERREKMAELQAALQRDRPTQFARHFPQGILPEAASSQTDTRAASGPLPTAQPQPKSEPVQEKAGAPITRRPPNLGAILLGVVAVLACVAAWSVVPEFRQMLGLDKLTPASVAVIPTHTPTSTPRPAATSTSTPPPTPASTITPAPDPCVCRGKTDEESLRCLITSESDAANRGDLSLIERIFSPDASIADRRAEVEWPNPRAHYAADFREKQYTSARHYGEVITVTGEGAWATSGSVGYFKRPGDLLDSSYGNVPPSDHWTFGRDTLGCWVITRFEFNAAHIPFPPTPQAQEATPTKRP
jgi:hypothetical protein